jgi:hypothetical protein
MTTAIVTSQEMTSMDRQSVVDILRATTQYRTVAFGQVRAFQSADVRRKNGGWQVLDQGRWWTTFWVE